MLFQGPSPQVAEPQRTGFRADGRTRGVHEGQRFRVPEEPTRGPGGGCFESLPSREGVIPSHLRTCWSRTPCPAPRNSLPPASPHPWGPETEVRTAGEEEEEEERHTSHAPFPEEAPSAAQMEGRQAPT